MTHRVTWSRPADRDVERVDRQVAQRVLDAIDQLAETGQGDVRLLHGRDRQWRLRLGDWRVIFTYAATDDALLIVRGLPRGRAYRDRRSRASSPAS